MIDIEELEGPVPINSGLPLAVYVPNREADEKAGCVMNDSHYRSYSITCGCCCTMENADEMGWTYATVSIYDAIEASENWDENGKIIEEGYALRFAKVLASAPTLLEEVKRLQRELDTQYEYIEWLEEFAPKAGEYNTAWDAYELAKGIHWTQMGEEE